MSDNVNEIKKIERSNGWTIVYILTAALVLCAFMVDSRIFQLFFGSEFSETQIGWNMISLYLFHNIELKISCLLLVLYVFIFRKKAFGSLVFPVIYTIKFAALIRAIISDIVFSFKFANDFSDLAASGDMFSIPIVNLIMDIILAVGCVVLMISAVKGFPKKPVLVVISTLFCIPYLYGLINYIIFIQTTENDYYSVAIGYCEYLLPILLYVTMLLIGLRKDYTSVADAFRREKNEPKRNKKLEKELYEYESVLEDLKIQFDSGLLSQKNYDEMVADVKADMEDIRNKYQK